MPHCWKSHVVAQFPFHLVNQSIDRALSREKTCFAVGEQQRSEHPGSLISAIGIRFLKYIKFALYKISVTPKEVAANLVLLLPLCSPL